MCFEGEIKVHAKVKWMYNFEAGKQEGRDKSKDSKRVQAFEITGLQHFGKGLGDKVETSRYCQRKEMEKIGHIQI